MADDAKKVFDDFFPKLVKQLPLKDAYFLAALTQQNLFHGNLKDEVKSAPTQADAATVFLDKAIRCSLETGDKEAFDKLLHVMEKSDNRLLTRLADRITQKLNDSITHDQTEASATQTPVNAAASASKVVTDQKKALSPDQSIPNKTAAAKAFSSDQCSEDMIQQNKMTSDKCTTGSKANKTKSSLDSNSSERIAHQKGMSLQEPTSSKVATNKTSLTDQFSTTKDAAVSFLPAEHLHITGSKGKPDKNVSSPADHNTTSTDPEAADEKKESLPKQGDTCNKTVDHKDVTPTQELNESPSFAEVLQSGQYHINWTSCSDLPWPCTLYNASVAVSTAGDTVYATAWDAPDKNTETNVYCYYTKTDRWRVLPKPRHRRGTLCMLDDKLTIIGGDDPVTKETLNRVTTYNSYTNSWYQCYPKMISRRFKPGVITYDSYVIVMGGKNGKDTVYSSIEVMDYRNLQPWKVVSAYLPAPMWNIRPIVSGRNIAIVGCSVDDRSNEHFQIPVDEIISSARQQHFSVSKWKRLAPTAHYEAAAVPCSNPPMVIGGITHVHQGSILTPAVAIYDSSKNTWRQVDSLLNARDCVGVGLINNTTIIVIGGTRGSGGVRAAKATSLPTVEIGTVVPNQ